MAHSPCFNFCDIGKFVEHMTFSACSTYTTISVARDPLFARGLLFVDILGFLNFTKTLTSKDTLLDLVNVLRQNFLQSRTFV